MGTARPEREEPLARTAYVAAARRFVNAFASLVALGVPVDPGRATGKVPDWSSAHVAVLRELHAALGEMHKARQRWDGVRHHRGPDR